MSPDKRRPPRKPPFRRPSSVDAGKSVAPAMSNGEAGIEQAHQPGQMRNHASGEVECGNWVLK